jgi:ABC-type nitrate/sulfonate/bicarbonate transport system substrate-binding protein
MTTTRHICAAQSLIAACLVLPTAAFALSPKPAPLAQRETITVAVQEKAGFMAPLLLVGPVLESMNINYRPVMFQRYPDSRSAILSNAVDIGATGAPQVIQDLANGGDRLIALQGVAGIKSYPVVRKGLTIEIWSDLKGKKVGVGVGGNVWTAFVAKLNAEHIPYTEIKAIGIQGSGQNFNLALQHGDIDVSICWSPFVEQAVVQGIGYAPATLEFGYTQPVGPEQGMWVTTRENLQSKREVIRRFLWAFNSAEEQMNTSKEVKLDTLVKFTGLDPAVAAKTAEWISYGNNITPPQMQAMAKIMFELGVVPKDVSGQVKDHYDLALYDAIMGK